MSEAISKAVAHAADRKGLVFGVSALDIETFGGPKFVWSLKIAAQERNIAHCEAWLSSRPEGPEKQAWQRWITHAKKRCAEAKEENETRARTTAYRNRSEAWDKEIAANVRLSHEIDSP